MHPRDTRRVSASIRPELRPYLLALSLFADAEGYAWPSIAKLAAELGRHPGSVRRALAELERLGAIEAIDGRRGGRGRSTLWQIELNESRQNARINARINARTSAGNARTHARRVNSLEFEECASAREIEITAPELVPARIAELRSLLST
jgi:hypothetical protein